MCGGNKPESTLKQEVIPVKKKRTYRAKEIKSVSVGKVVEGRKGQKATVGIDVGKDEVFIVVRWNDSSYAGPWRAKNTAEIREVVELMATLAQDRELVVALEPTGTYGDPLRYALTRAGLNVHRVQGKIAHDYAEVFDGVPSQHDRKDAAVVAELAALGKSAPWLFDAESQEGEERSYWVQHLDVLQQMMQQWTGRIEGLLARHWPEVTALLKLQSVSLLKLLVRYGGPAGVVADEHAAARLSKWGRTMLTPAKIAAVLESARETVGVPQGQYERQWLKECARELLEARRARDKANRELKRLADGNEALSRLAAAIGFATASVLWVYLGTPQGYHCGEAYRKAMGLNLKERSSGKSKGQLRITKRGPGAVRRWMYLASMRLLREAEVRSWFEGKKARDGGRGGKALVGVMRKLAVALYRVAMDGVAFDAAKLFPGKPLKQANPSARARQKGPPLRAFAVTSIPEG